MAYNMLHTAYQISPQEMAGVISDECGNGR
jgi:hypothetical protein